MFGIILHQLLSVQARVLIFNLANLRIQLKVVTLLMRMVLKPALISNGIALEYEVEFINIRILEVKSFNFKVVYPFSLCTYEW
mgnify:CR=1 FL=1